MHADSLLTNGRLTDIMMLEKVGDEDDDPSYFKG